MRNIRKAEGKLVGDLVFASDKEAQTIATRYREGHITDFRMMLEPISGTEVQAGRSERTRWGVIEGPARVVQEWLALSVAIGVDS